MRKMTITLVIIAALVPSIWLLLDWIDRSQEVRWIGGFELTVQLIPSGEREIRAVTAAPLYCDDDIEAFQDSPDEYDDAVVIKQFRGESLRFHITAIGRGSGLGWRDTYYQYNSTLAVWVELDDGTKHVITAPIPDGRREKSMVVSVP